MRSDGILLFEIDEISISVGVSMMRIEKAASSSF
jgi:hypothetical protein